MHAGGKQGRLSRKASLNKGLIGGATRPAERVRGGTTLDLLMGKVVGTRMRKSGKQTPSIRRKRAAGPDERGLRTPQQT